MNYLSVIKGVEGGMTKLGTGLAKHPALERAERMLQAAWRTVSCTHVGEGGGGSVRGASVREGE